MVYKKDRITTRTIALAVRLRLFTGVQTQVSPRSNCGEQKQ